MLGAPWDTQVDVWSLGCILPEMIIGQPVFKQASIPEVLAAHIATIGPMPQYMRLHSEELANMFLAEDGLAYNIDPPGMPAGAYVLQPMPNQKLPRLIMDAANPKLFGGDLDSFIDHVSKMLTLDPQHRPTAAMASQHPWLAGQMSSVGQTPAAGSSAESPRFGAEETVNMGSTTKLPSTPTASVVSTPSSITSSQATLVKLRPPHVGS